MSNKNELLVAIQNNKIIDEIKNITSELKSKKPITAPKPTTKQIKAWEQAHKSPKIRYPKLFYTNPTPYT